MCEGLAVNGIDRHVERALAAITETGGAERRRRERSLRVIGKAITLRRHTDQIEVHFAIHVGVVEDGYGIGSGRNAGEIAHANLVVLLSHHGAESFLLMAWKAVWSVK